jgi:hypothetical protein
VSGCAARARLARRGANVDALMPSVSAVDVGGIRISGANTGT